MKGVQVFEYKAKCKKCGITHIYKSLTKRNVDVISYKNCSDCKVEVTDKHSITIGGNASKGCHNCDFFKTYIKNKYSGNKYWGLCTKGRTATITHDKKIEEKEDVYYLDVCNLHKMRDEKTKEEK